MAIDPWTYAAKTRKEHAEQVALFMWCNMAMRFGLAAANDSLSYSKAGHAQSYIQPANGHKPIPQLKWLHAVHNQGHGDAIRGAQAKAEGVKAGVADIFLPVPIKSEVVEPIRAKFTAYSGLYIELKRKDSGKPHLEQLDFQADMRAAGYKCELCHGWEAARDEILNYLGIAA